jgi:hypothetical protein
MGVTFSFPGRPLQDVPEAGPRSRTYYDYTWKHDFWWEEYLPAMTEFLVEGAVRNPAAWSEDRALPIDVAAGAPATESSAK